MPRHAFYLVAFLIALVATPARGQANAPERTAESIEAVLDAGDLDRARQLLAAALQRDPDDLNLLELRLRVLREGTEASFIEGRQIKSVAQRILRLDPDNAAAHEALGRLALQDVLFFQHKTSLDIAYDGRGESAFEAADHSPAFLRSRFLKIGRFDLDAVREVFTWTDASGPAEPAALEARRHLEAAIRAEPLAFDAYTPLATLYTAQGAWSDLAQFGAVDAAEVQAPEAAWQIPLWQAVAAYNLGDAAAAADHLYTARATMPAQEQARLDDLTPLLTPDQVAAYQANPEPFAREFWSRADPRLLTLENERKAEHAIRFAQADLLFGWGDARGATTDRGRIWLRYGEPEERVLFSGFVYPGDGLGMTPEIYEVWQYRQLRYVFRDPYRSGAFQTYSPSSEAYTDVNIAAQAERDDYVALDRQRQRETPQASQYAPRQRLDLPVMTSAFLGPGGAQELVVAYGIPLASAPEAPSIALPLATGTFLLGQGNTPLAERRRSFESLPSRNVAAFPSATLWVGSESFAVPSGTRTVAVEAEVDGDRAVGLLRIPFVPVQPGVPGLSDVLLASNVEEGATGPVTRRGYGIHPLPMAVAARQDPIYIYFETYALSQDASGQTRFEIEVALVPDDGRSGVRKAWDALRGRQPEGGIAIGFDGQGDDADQGHYLILDASALRPGTFTLELRVRDAASGAEALSTREMLLE